MGRGTFKYICEECNADNWLSKRDRDSRFKPKCVECGSPWIEPSKCSKGPDMTATARDASHERTRMMEKKMGVND